MFFVPYLLPVIPSFRKNSIFNLKTAHIDTAKRVAGQNSGLQFAVSDFQTIDLLGVNNRHLGTFHTDTIRSFLLAERLPSHLPWVSESGIAHPKTLRQLRKAGYQGFLIGETFMKTPQPHTTLANFIRSCL